MNNSWFNLSNKIDFEQKNLISETVPLNQFNNLVVYIVIDTISAK